MYLRRTNDVELVKDLHTRCFPDDAWEDATAYWVLWTKGGRPVGFCSAYRLKRERGMFLTRSGLLRGVRGSGLQRRMIAARLRWARAQGLTFAVTYTSYDNHASIVNLLRSGFRFYDPAHPWVGSGVHYFIRGL